MKVSYYSSNKLNATTRAQHDENNLMFVGFYDRKKSRGFNIITRVNYSAGH